MAKCKNNFLCYKNLTAIRTLLACGDTISGTCSILCLADSNLIFVKTFNITNIITIVTRLVTIIIVSMSVSRNSLLCKESFTTYGALLTVSKTCFGTGGSLACYGFFLMTKCINCYGLSGKLCITYRTVNYVVIRACVYAIRSNVVLYYCLRSLVTKLINCYGLSGSLCITYRTVNYVVIRACVYAIRSNVVLYYRLRISMTKFSDFFLCKESFATYGTLLTIGKTCFGTSSILACYGFFCVVNHLDCLGVRITTRASEGLNTLCTTGRSSSYLLGVAMYVSRNLSLSNCNVDFTNNAVTNANQICACFKISLTCATTKEVKFSVKDEYKCTVVTNEFIVSLFVRNESNPLDRKVVIVEGITINNDLVGIANHKSVNVRSHIIGILCTANRTYAVCEGVTKSLDHLRSLNFILAFSICEHLTTFTAEVFFQAGLHACRGFSVYLGKRMLMDVTMSLALISTGANVALEILTATTFGACTLAIMELCDEATSCHSKNQRKREQKHYDLFHFCFLQK